MKLNFRQANIDDAPLLGAMNARLIRDEGHRNQMSLAELQERHMQWLATEYQAVLFSADERAVGYALYRHESEWVYLRQFFVEPEHRRQGIGRAAMVWLMDNVWKIAPRIRLDVLVGNGSARKFWEAIGFHEYCVTMELDRQDVTS